MLGFSALRATDEAGQPVVLAEGNSRSPRPRAWKTMVRGCEGSEAFGVWEPRKRSQARTVRAPHLDPRGPLKWGGELESPRQAKQRRMKMIDRNTEILLWGEYVGVCVYRQLSPSPHPSFSLFSLGVGENFLAVG